jgi:hypothetical protein
MRAARVVYDRPLLATAMVFVGCTLVVAVVSELRIAPVWLGLYRSMAIFPHFSHVMDLLEACGTESRAAIFAMSGAIALLVYWLLLGFVLLELFSRFSRWSSGRIAPAGEQEDSVSLSSQLFAGARFGLSLALLAIASGAMGLYWHFQVRSADEGSIACSSSSMTNDYFALRYPLAAWFACYCVMQAIRGFVFFVCAMGNIARFRL